MKIHGIVVWFNPTQEHAFNISSFAETVHMVTIVDNSSHSNIHLAEMILGNIEYVPNLNNLGVARALNIGRGSAIRSGADWILTMDQDSSFGDHFREFVQCAEEMQDQEDISIFAPRVFENTSGGFVESAVTSGNLVRVIDCDAVGGYDDSLFIDEIDFDFCLRLRSRGKKIYLVPHVQLRHKLGGDTICKTVFGMRFFSYNYSATRRYYITRNRLEMMRRWPGIRKTYAAAEIKDFLKITLVEPDRVKRIWHQLRGAIDFARRRFGRIDDPHPVALKPAE